MKERTVADRCKDIFVRQMAQANEAMVSGGGAAKPAAKKQKPGSGGSDKGQTQSLAAKQKMVQVGEALCSFVSRGLK